MFFTGFVKIARFFATEPHRTIQLFILIANNKCSYNHNRKIDKQNKNNPSKFKVLFSGHNVISKILLVCVADDAQAGPSGSLSSR